MSELTQDLLKDLFDYRDGELYWKKSGTGRNIGAPAGSVGKIGYRYIGISDKRYRAHRLIFLYHHGYLPKSLDHIDGNKSNNSIDNLREATQQENCMNTKKPKSHNGKSTTSKYKGVSRHKQAKKWMVYIQIDGKGKYLGLYTSEIEAAKAYDKAAIERDGKFARTNKAMGLLRRI